MELTLTVSNLLKQRKEGGKRERGMSCGRWVRESRTSIHLCQGQREERGEKKGLGEGVWGAGRGGANEAPNHVLHLRVILGV